MPPKPRVSAPKRGPLDPAARRQRMLLYALAASGLVALAVVVVVLAATGGGGSGTGDVARVRSAAEAADCSFQSIAALRGAHSLQPDGHSPQWNTAPPTSGAHYEIPAVWGAYSEALQPARVVHNLEHGGIFIQYGDDVPAARVQQLRTFYDAHTRGTLLAPLPSLGDQIAIGVWTAPKDDFQNGTAHLMKCKRFDEAAFSAFFEEFQFKGPERFPADTLLPGH